MLIGVPKEIKNHEYRIGMTPAGVREVIEAGHQVMMQKDGGTAIGLTDEMYVADGATIIDTAEFIYEDISSLAINGLQTVALVMVILFFFLGWKEALIAGLAIPMTFLMTFAFMRGIGSTINFLSLFSLILSLGILIDSAIVVVEGIHANIKRGLTPFITRILR